MQKPLAFAIPLSISVNFNAFNAWVQAENLLMVHPEKRSVQDSVAQFLQPPCHWSGYEINQKQEALVLNLILPDLE